MHDARTSEATAVATARYGRTVRAAIAAALTGALVLGASWTTPTDAAPQQSTPTTLRKDQQTTADLRDHYEEVTAEELAIFESYNATSARVSELTTQVESLSASLVEAQAQVAAAEAEVARSEQNERELGHRLRETEAELKSEEERLKTKAISAYIRGGEGPTNGAVDAVIRADDPNDVGRAKAYGDAVVQDQRAIVRRVTELKDEVDRLHEAAKVALAESTRQRDELEQHRAAVQTQRDQIAGLQAEATAKAEQQHQLLQQVAAKRSEIAQRLAEAEQRSNAISALLAERQRGQVLPVLTGAVFSMPVAQPRLSSPFGLRVDPVTGGAGAQHNGLDFSAPSGTPILAAGDGVVVSASEAGGYGNCTIIDHGNGLSTLYGHQSEFKVKNGDVVKRGDVIGLVGSTGKSTGPHLHFEVRAFGVPHDPMPYLGLKPVVSS